MDTGGWRRVVPATSAYDCCITCVSCYCVLIRLAGVLSVYSLFDEMLP
jgi:hypothetical protein